MKCKKEAAQRMINRSQKNSRNIWKRTTERQTRGKKATHESGQVISFCVWIGVTFLAWKHLIEFFILLATQTTAHAFQYQQGTDNKISLAKRMRGIINVHMALKHNTFSDEINWFLIVYMRTQNNDQQQQPRTARLLLRMAHKKPNQVINMNISVLVGFVAAFQWVFSLRTNRITMRFNACCGRAITPRIQSKWSSSVTVSQRSEPEQFRKEEIK